MFARNFLSQLFVNHDNKGLKFCHIKETYETLQKYEIDSEIWNTDTSLGVLKT